MREPARRGIVAMAATVMLIAAACTGGDGGDSGEGSGGGEAAAGAPTTVSVSLADFTISPADIEVAADAPVTLEVTNDGLAPHTFGVVVDGATIETPNIDAGASATLELPALAAGTYDTLCTVAGHTDLGMVGTLTASAGGEHASGSTGATGATGASGASGAPVDHSAMTAEEMAAGHEQGVKDFLAGDVTDTRGGQLLEPVIKGGVKVYNLAVSQLEWEVDKGEFVDAMAFNGQIPGPEMRVNPGDRVRFVTQNQMDQPFVLHFHGLTVPNSEDGVPYVTQPPVMPGEYWTYEFTIKDPPGLYVYHSHFNSTEQVGKGLYGAIIVEPRDGDWSSVYGQRPDVETTIFTGDGPLGFGLNAKSFPATAPIVAEKGDWILVNLANDGAQLHPMHLHGYHFTVVGVDGYPLPPEDRYLLDTIVVAPGARYSIMFKAQYPGAWAFHCHILPHVETAEGMFGMVTAVVVQ